MTCDKCKDTGQVREPARWGSLPKPCRCKAGQPFRLQLKRERAAREATFAKCKECGNVLGLERVEAGIKRCRGCLPDDQIQQHDQLFMLSQTLDNISDPYAREAIGILVDIVNKVVRNGGAR